MSDSGQTRTPLRLTKERLEIAKAVLQEMSDRLPKCPRRYDIRAVRACCIDRAPAEEPDGAFLEAEVAMAKQAIDQAWRCGHQPKGQAELIDMDLEWDLVIRAVEELSPYWTNLHPTCAEGGE